MKTLADKTSLITNSIEFLMRAFIYVTWTLQFLTMHFGIIGTVYFAFMLYSNPITISAAFAVGTAIYVGLLVMIVLSKLFMVYFDMAIVKNKNEQQDEAKNEQQDEASTIEIGEFILNSGVEYNGHKQFEFNDISVSELRSLEQSIQKFSKNNVEVSLHEEFRGGYSYSINEINYWDEGEHHLGHRDRLLVSGSVVNSEEENKELLKQYGDRISMLYVE